MCETIVFSSRSYGSTKINFVLTINSEGTDKAIHRYFYKDGYSEWSRIYADANSIGRYQAGLQRCFKAAVDAGFTVLHITPHVDPKDQNGKGVWRNLVKFDPLAKLGGYSYSDVLLEPAARALNAVVKKDTVVEFALSAEQGLAIFSYPQQWLKLVSSTKAISSAGKDKSKHLYGLSFNFDKVCGCVVPDESDPIKYNVTYLDRFKQFKAKGGLNTVDVPGVKSLFSGVDFLGCSAYASLPATLKLADMEISIQTVAFELAAFGINLKDYMNKPFVYSEHGVGGYSSKGNQIAPDLAALAKYPMRGVWLGQYSVESDPWRNAQYKQYRRQLYRLLSMWASQGGGPIYRIDGVYGWSVGTWDALGVHPSANSWAGTYADDEIRTTIRGANAKVNSRSAAVPAVTLEAGVFPTGPVPGEPIRGSP